MKKKSLNEWAGNSLYGAPSFQGFAFGYGNQQQLARPENHVSDDFEEIVDNIVADKLSGISLEEVLFAEQNISERDISVQFHHDLPGSPGGPDALVAQRDHVPEDPAEKDNINLLGPTVGGYSLMDYEHTPNDWKSTTPDRLGNITIDMNTLAKDLLPHNTKENPLEEEGIWGKWKANELVAPRDWQQELEQSLSGDITANLPQGGMGNISNPRTHVPMSANVAGQRLKTEEQTLITNKECVIMSLSKLKSLIYEVVIKEISKNVQQFGSEELMGQIHANLADIIAKHGGDYARASSSPEWSKVIQQAQQDIESQVASQKKETEANRENSINPISSLFPKVFPKPQDKPGAKTSSMTMADKTSMAKKGLSGPVGTSSEEQQIPATRISIQEKQMVGGKMNKVSLEEHITKIASKVIKEEITKLSEMFSGSILTKPNLEEPTHGDMATDENGQDFYFDGETRKWYPSEEFDKLASHRVDDNIELDSLEAANSGSGSLTDPQDNMTPDEKERITNNLLDLEFSDDNEKMTVPGSVLEFLVRKAVRNRLFGGK